MVLILLAMAGDLLTFALFVGQGTVELNPVMARAYATFGLTMVALLKVIVSVTLILLVLRTKGPKRRPAVALALIIPMIGIIGNLAAGIGVSPVTATEPTGWDHPQDWQFQTVVVDATMTPATWAIATSSPAQYARVEAATSVPAQRPTAQPSAGTSQGTATWYDDGPGLYAAVGTWHWHDTPYELSVCTPAACVTVTIRDFCRACADGRRIIDLSPDAFQQLAPLSQGVVRVSLR